MKRLTKKVLNVVVLETAEDRLHDVRNVFNNSTCDDL
jgi:hypothetical protein